MRPRALSLALSLSLSPLVAAAQSPTTTSTAATESALQLGQTFSLVADRMLPAVVSVVVELTPRNQSTLNAPPGFWGAAPEESQRRAGSGSGVVLRQDGVIVTNFHVVEDATRIRVRLFDGRSFAARVLGVDPATDLAVLKVDVEGLAVARLGDSDDARVGEWVLAIGAPFGLEATVTHGVISAKGRGGFGINQIEDYLQTDASINPGNSGGALINLRGEVLGINTLVVGRGNGIGFAIPARIVEYVVRQIVASGRVVRGWIGVSTQDITPDLERTHGPSGSGAIVNFISPQGPARAAGLRLSDVVTAVDGHRVRNEHDMLREIASRAVGERLTLSVRRQGQPAQVTVTTALRPGEAPAAAPPPAPPPDPGPTGFGMSVDAVPPLLAQRLGLQANEGVLIVEVHPGGAGDRGGLRPGDVIIEADGRPVRGPSDVVEAARDHHAVLLVRRGNVQEYVGLHTGP